MRDIKKAKKAKEYLQSWCDDNLPALKAAVKIVMHENDVAIQITFIEKPPNPWANSHEGFPLIIKHPA